MKKSKVIILTCIFVLIIVCAVLIALYFTTDWFKSNKALFYKYASQIKAEKIVDTSFFSEQNVKMQNNKTQREGSISLEVVEDTTKEEFFKVNYSSNSDKENNLFQTFVKLNSGNDEIISFNIVNNDNLYGIIIDDILNVYIALENKNLKDFAEKLGIEDTESIPDEINFDGYSSIRNITDEEEKQLEELYNEYVSMIFEQIPNENYSKLEKSSMSIAETELQVNGYKLSLSGLEVKTIAKKLIQTLRDDQRVFNQISRVYPEKGLTLDTYKSEMDEILNSFDSEEMQDEEFLESECISITVYERNRELVRADVEIKDATNEINSILEYSVDETILTIDIIQNDEDYNNQPYVSESIIKIINTQKPSELNFNMEISSLVNKEEKSNSSLNISRIGDISSNQIQHEIIFKTSSSSNEMIVTLNDEVNFVSNTEIERFNKDNHVILNDMQSEELQSLFSEIGELIMRQLEERSDNPLGEMLSLILGDNGIISKAEEAVRETKIAQMRELLGLANAEISMDKYMYGQNSEVTQEEVANKLKEQGDITDEQYFELIEKGYITIEDKKISFDGEIINDEISNATELMNEYGTDTYNLMFLAYEGQQPGSNVRSLMSKIINMNEMYENQVTVTVSGISYSPMEARDLISARHTYEISFSYENGYIVSVHIEE